jgi:hypothetical protein
MRQHLKYKKVLTVCPVLRPPMLRRMQGKNKALKLSGNRLSFRAFKNLLV